MRILLVDECYPLNTRNTKILKSFSSIYRDCEIHVLTWDRLSEYTREKEDGNMWEWHIYTRHAVYGNKMQKLAGLFGYRSFCVRTIRKITPDIIVASHWNNLLMLPSIDYKKQMLIYENLDAPTGPAFGRFLLNRIERFYMKKALTIHASRFYSLIYPRKYRQLVLENKPNIDAKAVGYSPGKPLRIAYLGNIRYLNILKNLADALRGDERFVLYYHGGGPDFLTLREYVSGESNIIMTGSYRYDDIEHLYANADIIWSAYPNRDFNVRYAISNKFHESLAYAVPAIYAGNTCLGEYASSNGLGFQVNPYDVESIRCLLNEIVSDSQRLVQMSASLRHQYAEETSWQEDFMKVKKEVDAFFSRH